MSAASRARLTGRSALLVALLAGAVIEAFWLHALDGLDRRVQDWLVARHAAHRVPDSDVVRINIDERSLDALKDTFGTFPWPRSVYAEFIEKVAARQPAAIVFDLSFAEPDVEHPDADAYFLETALAHGNVYLPLVVLEAGESREGLLSLDEYGERLGFTRTAAARDGAGAALLLPPAEFALTARIGAINFLADFDGIGRRYYVYLERDGWRIPSLPARVAQDLGLGVPDQPAIEINWRGMPEARSQFSFVDIFEDLGRQRPQRPAEELRGKILVIGMAAASFPDFYATPLTRLHLGADILAAAIETLKNRDWLRRPPPVFAAAQTAILILFVAWLFRRRLGPLRAGAVLALLTPAVVFSAGLALEYRWLLPVVPPLAGGWFTFLLFALGDYLQERRARRHAVQVFSRFVNPHVVADLIARHDDLLHAPGASRVITVLFSDIRGFTTLSETRPPEEVVALLNRYFSRQVEVIFRHGGTVDKFIGDAIMAFWGAPREDGRQAENAVRAALDMTEVLAGFRTELAGLGSKFDIGIGIHTGPAVVGFIGSENKLDYTAIGDTVNLASRIEGLTKGVARILVSEATRHACGDGMFEFIDHGMFKVKGREQPVRLFEPRRRNP
ncbi:MAG TPA: adenylate/guanylate cyclase domain-containing protein [Gammaproteobacteria bacterium]|nr:adenylate/guanylate cyclase domain-containing protein [Gammaproteobacteria bacterium]